MKSNQKGIDRKLADKIREGNKKAFKRFYRRYYEALLRFCYRYVKSRSIAEGIVQEVFADVWDKNKSWNPRKSVKVYLYQTVKFRALDYVEHEKVKQRNESAWMRRKEEAYIRINKESENIMIREAVRRAVANLPSRCRMTYKLHRKDGLTYKEIADVMEVSVKTVESQMGQALKRIRAELKSHEIDFSLFYKD